MKREKTVILTFLIIAGTFAILSPKTNYCSSSLNKFGSYTELKEFLRPRQYEPSEYMAALKTMDSSLPEAMGSNDYSGTNIQVEGVDEADIIKTDGRYIYAICGQTVVIVEAYHAEAATVKSRVTVNGTLKQIFINTEKLIAFHEDYSQLETRTFISIFDVWDKEDPIPERQIAFEGYYFTSRMIGEYVYVIVRKSAYLIHGEVTLPKIYLEGKCKVKPATEIYCSRITHYAYTFTTIAAVNVEEGGEEPVDETILSGWTTNIYVSKENIYMAIVNGDKTVLHRIHIQEGEIDYVADGEVVGRVLNQFFMDEYASCFRIATTWGGQNNLYVLNINLDVLGELKNIAPGETIDSVRFIGNRCYLTTSIIRKDPFFVISTENVTNPKILGYLKIPGFTRYLHPYDENHVVGIGKDADNNVKISLFDVTNVSDPIEKCKFKIEGYWSDTPVLTEHKAFLFDKPRKLLVIPVYTSSITNREYLSWQGAYVFSISLEENMKLRGTITHIENGDAHGVSCNVVRMLYIGEVLYTISESKIKMNSMLSLDEINEVNLNE